jgi:hypothetical protein
MFRSRAETSWPWQGVEAGFIDLILPICVIECH